MSQEEMSTNEAPVETQATEAPVETQASETTAPASSDPWGGEFDLDSFLGYDPFKKREEMEEGSKAPTDPNAPDAQVPAPSAPQEAPPPPQEGKVPPVEALPESLELQMLREQLAQMQTLVNQQQQNNGQQPLVQNVDQDLAQHYQVPPNYNQLTVPESVLNSIMSGEPAQVAQGLNQFAQGLAQIVHNQVNLQAQTREALIAQRTEERALAPYKAQQQQTQANTFHDTFYGKHSDLDKQHLKPYIAMKMKQYAAQIGMKDPTPAFLDWGAQKIRAELIASGSLQANAAPVVPAAPPAPAVSPTPFMSGSGAARASSAGASSAQDDIFNTLMN